MKMSRKAPTLQNPFLLLLLSGLLLNLSFFIHSIYTGILALFSIAPAFYALSKLKTKHRYLGGLIFFSTWLLPTTYWYYLFMPIWGAILASIGFVLLIANLFHISNLFKKKSLKTDFSIIIASWVGFTLARTLLPVLEDGWIPHIAYTQWLNPLMIQLASFGDIYSIMLVMLSINAFLAYLIIKKKRLVAVSFMIVISVSCLIGNKLIQNLNTSSDGEDIVLVAVQSPYYNNIQNLMDITNEALSSIERTNRPIVAIWPENMTNPEEETKLQKFAQEKNIYLGYNRATPTETYMPYNSAVLISNDGEVILTNHKKHAAPGEEITESDKFESSNIGNISVTADICYDIHYPDISERLVGQDLLLAPIDDSEYGSYMPYLHAADVVFRAAGNRTNIITSATTGPTFFANKYGVPSKILPFYTEDILIIETKI